MQKVLLLYNPLSGRRQDRRLADVEAITKIFQNAGATVSASRTGSSSEAARQASEAAANGFDTIFACGGDGTIHDVLQGIVGTNAVLGIIPLGTANALAHDLDIPRSAIKAAQLALKAQPRRFAVGKVEFQDFSGNRASRYFTVTAGIGVDAHLFYNLNPEFKKRHGMAAYYAKAWHLWATHNMPFFNVEWNDEAGLARKESATELLAVRISNFGGVLRKLAPGASLDRNDLRLVLCKTARRTAYLHYVFQRLLQSRKSVRDVELAYAHALTCTQRSDTDPTIYIEADGELLGTLPATISMMPDAFNLLVPSNERS